MPERIRVVLARLGGQPVACAIFFIEGEVLYGRYWGCEADFHSLHFETCFYQGIELALALGCKRFEPGAQGEHKLRRGFRLAPGQRVLMMEDVVTTGLSSKEAIAAIASRTRPSSSSIEPRSACAAGSSGSASVFTGPPSRAYGQPV